MYIYIYLIIYIHIKFLLYVFYCWFIYKKCNAVKNCTIAIYLLLILIDIHYIIPCIIIVLYIIDITINNSNYCKLFTHYYCICIYCICVLNMFYFKYYILKWKMTAKFKVCTITIYIKIIDIRYIIFYIIILL